MKVIFFETTNATPLLETSLELAKIHLDQGDIVEYHFLGHSLDYCEFVSTSRISLCLPERIGSKLIANRNLKFIVPRKSNVMLGVDFPDISDLENLQAFRYKGYAAGLSALSSLISFTRNSKPDLVENHTLLKRIIVSGISAYEYCLNVLESNTIDRVYLFNGRFANNRAILDAAIEKKIPYMIHERGANKFLYTAKPYMPHDFEKIRSAMLDAWRNRSKGDIRLAKSFFEERRDGSDQGWLSFTSYQKKGHFKLDREPKKIIAYFSSSEDEFSSVGDIVKWERWPNQISAVRNLIDIVRRFPEWELFVRIHPHMSKKHKDDLQDWINLDLPKNAKLILPDDKTDTYELINRADVVVTCGSTVGIESVYWGTPSICLGPSLYSHLDAVYLPNDDNELELMLLANDLVANSDQALTYGYFMSTFGEPFVYYQPKTLFSGHFLGVNLQQSGPCAYFRRIRSLMLRGIRDLLSFRMFQGVV